MSVARPTVGDMTTTRIHTCIYFDDGGFEHLCTCGSRAVHLTEQDGVLDGTEPVLVVLDDDVAQAAGQRRRELAVSA